MVEVSLEPDRQLRRLGEGLTVFQASSKSRPGTYHFVIVYPDERGIQCTCEGWRYNSKCWHIEAVPLCMAKKPVYKEEKKATGGYTFNMTAIEDCYYVEGHQGGHSWET